MSGYPFIVVPSLTLVALVALVHLRQAVADPGIEVGATAGVGVRAGVRAGQPREAHHAGQRRRRHRREQEDEDDDQEVVVGDEVEVGEGDEGHGGDEGGLHLDFAFAARIAVCCRLFLLFLLPVFFPSAWCRR